MIKIILKSIKRRIIRLTLSKAEKRHGLVGPGRLWKMKRDFQIEFLKNQNLKQTNRLLDIGCGTLRGGIPIIDFLDSGNYSGIDVRENALLEGKRELKEHDLEHKTPRLLHFRDFDDLDLSDKFDMIFAFSVLTHLEDTIAESCFHFVSQHLSKDGVFYANVSLGIRKDGSWQGFPIVWRSLEFYRDLCDRNGLNLEVMGNLGDLGHNSGVESQDNQTMLKIQIN